MAQPRPRTHRVQRKKKKSEAIPDPLHLDGGPYAETLKRIEQDLIALKGRVPDEPRHPLLKDRRVAALVRRLEQFENSLKSRGGMRLHDAYYEFNEGMMLRAPVLVKVIMDYILAHPEMFKNMKRKK